MNIYSALLVIGVAQGWVLVSILISNNRKKLNEDIYLAMLLAIVTGYLSKELLIVEGYFNKIPHLMAAFVPLFFMLGPLFYYYVRSSVTREFKLKYFDLIHLVPSIICFITILPFYLKSGSEKLAMYNLPGPELHLTPSRAFYYGLIWLSAVLYCLQSYRLIIAKLNPPDQRNFRRVKARLRWLKKYTLTFMVFLGVFLIAQLIFIFTDYYQYEVVLITKLSSTALIHVAGYWAIKESRIISNEETRKSGLFIDGENSSMYKKKIIFLLEDEKCYLKPELSSDYFCEKLGLNHMYFSQLINNEFKCSFTQLVNSYRIEAAKKLIQNREHHKLNMLGIAMEAGFQTKNTFTRAFKKHTGKTPSEYMSSLKA